MRRRRSKAVLMLAPGCPGPGELLRTCRRLLRFLIHFEQRGMERYRSYSLSNTVIFLYDIFISIVFFFFPYCFCRRRKGFTKVMVDCSLEGHFGSVGGSGPPVYCVINFTVWPPVLEKASPSLSHLTIITPIRYTALVLRAPRPLLKRSENG